jgi:hypothetical protein
VKFFPLWSRKGLIPPTGPFVHTGPTTSLATLTVSPSSASIVSPNTQTFTASGRYLDGTTASPVPNVVWSSSDPTISPIDPTTGIASVGPNSGNVVITGTDAASGVFGTASLMVTGGITGIIAQRLGALVQSLVGHATVIVDGTAAQRLGVLRQVAAGLSLPDVTGTAAQRLGGLRQAATGNQSTFLPTNISGCVEWLRSDLGITLNGSTVSAWADQSGNGNNVTQGTALKQPGYSASGGALGNAYTSWTSNSAQILKGTLAATLNTAYEYFFIADYDGAGTDNYGLDFGANFSAVNNTGSGGVWSPGQAASAINFSGVATNVPHIINYQAGVASSAATIDGGSPLTNGAAPSSGLTSIQIGSYGGDLGAFGWGGKIYEVIVYNRALTSGERTQINNYAVSRYGT